MAVFLIIGYFSLSLSQVYKQSINATFFEDQLIKWTVARALKTNLIPCPLSPLSDPSFWASLTVTAAHLKSEFAEELQREMSL